MALDKDLILDIADAAAELQINQPSFIEKDWYATQAMKAIAAIESKDASALFCGGTSLSKGYGLINRFSEDLDYRGVTESGAEPGKGPKSRYRKEVIAAIDSVEGLTVNKDSIKRGGNFFKMDVEYDPIFDIPDSLRQSLQIEFSYTQPAHTAGFQDTTISSIADDYAGDKEKAFTIQSIAPIETAADKLSAMTWRVLKRDRTNENDDPSIVRHLHDLHALKEIIDNDFDQFKALVDRSHEIDSKKVTRDTGMPIAEAARQAYDMIISDPEYAKEYTRFVQAMSYQKVSERASISDVADHFLSIVDRLSLDERDESGSSVKKESIINSSKIRQALSMDSLAALTASFDVDQDQNNTDQLSDDDNSPR